MPAAETADAAGFHSASRPSTPVRPSRQPSTQPELSNFYCHQAEPGDLPGLLAWHMILIVAQPGRKRDPDASAREPPASGKIVEDHYRRVFVCDSQLGNFLLESKRQGQSGQNVSVG